MSSAFFFLQYVYLALEVCVRVNGTRCAEYLSSFDFVSLYASKKCSDVVTCFCSVKKLSEHFYSGYNYFSLLFCKSYDFYFVSYFKYASFYSSCCYCSTSCDGEYVFYRHQEWLIVVSFRFRNVAVYCFEQFYNLVSPWACRIF